MSRNGSIVTAALAALLGSLVGCNYSAARLPILSAPWFRETRTPGEVESVRALRKVLAQASVAITKKLNAAPAERDRFMRRREKSRAPTNIVSALVGSSVSQWDFVESPEANRLVVYVRGEESDKAWPGSVRVFARGDDDWYPTRTLTLPEHQNFLWADWDTSERILLAYISYPGQYIGSPFYRALAFSTLVFDVDNAVLYQIHSDTWRPMPVLIRNPESNRPAAADAGNGNAAN